MTTKEKILSLVQKLGDDVTIDQVLNRLFLLKKIDIALAEAARGEGVEHEEFFQQLQEEDEKKNKAALASPRPKKLAGTKKIYRPKLPKKRPKVRPKT